MTEKRKVPSQKEEESGVCPKCGEIDFLPQPDLRCICSPIWIWIPPGKHIHIWCPVHGDIKIYGSNVSSGLYCSTQ